MSDEEAIKILDKFTTEHKLFNIKHSDGLEVAIEILLTAYEKQNKIIDLMANDLKTPVNSKEWIIEYYKKRCEDAKD